MDEDFVAMGLKLFRFLRSADVGIVKAFQIFGSEIPAKFHIDHVLSTWRPVVLGLRLSMLPTIPQTGLRGFPQAHAGFQTQLGRMASYKNNLC